MNEHLTKAEIDAICSHESGQAVLEEAAKPRRAWWRLW